MPDATVLPVGAGTLARQVEARSVLCVVASRHDMHAGDHGDVDDSSPSVVVADSTLELQRRFDVAWIDGSVNAVPSEMQRAAVHQAVQHLAPGGWLGVAAGDAQQLAELFDEFDLIFDTSMSTESMLVFRRPERTTVHDLLFEARTTIRRLDAETLQRSLRSADPPVVVDTRTHVDRARTGVIAGSIHVPRTVLEWHLDPANGRRHPAVTSFDRAVVVVCNGGYSSSLAAANLGRLGFTDVADLIGGVHSWCAEGFPTVEPDHSYLDL
jgi:rhodanese-related sulfurtransferase